MKLIQQILIVALAGYLLAQFLPWWSVALAGALGALLREGVPGRSFWAGFLGIFVLWAGMAGAQMINTGSDLPEKFSQLLPGSPGGLGLLLIAAFIGGLIAGLGGLSGALSYRAVFGKPRRRR